MRNQKSRDKADHDSALETTVSGDPNRADGAMGQTVALPPTDHEIQVPAAVAPTIPSDQLMASLAKQPNLPSSSEPSIEDIPEPGKSFDTHSSGKGVQVSAKQVRSWLERGLELPTDAFAYLRIHTGHMSDNADPIAMASSDEAEKLRNMLYEQLATGTKRSDLIKATIANRAQFCAAIGGLFALPGTIPGIGTVAQLALGMAGTWPEAYLIRYQMWCLQVEQLYLLDWPYSEADAEILKKASLSFDMTNKSKEVVTRTLVAKLPKESGIKAILQRILVKVGAASAFQVSAQKILAKALPLGIGVGVGSTMNYVKLRMFAREQRYYDQLAKLT